ncbi:hypothetical protein GCM10010287_17840 [Streptomyces variabilis]|uniref:Integrase n=2 Tax=Streptomyces variabilis TaxID=67372 RepID=A0ABQ2TXM8_9ACTN|nr:hypothetical protein GCM10010265_58520 [Streptomyces griseoincarnatus]GGT45095.1 hypothetical protein GCM10010287_17840 [Streptomyces variabilis]
MGSERRERMRVLGARLRALRAEAGLTGAALAHRAGVGQPTVSKVETGRLVPSVDVLDRLRRALSLDESAAREVRDLLVAVESAIDTDSEAAGLPAGLVVDDAVRGARSVRSFQCVVLPGLLQSAEYARHVFESAPDSAPAANVLEYGVELEALPSNPLSRVRRKRGKRAVQEVDRRVVVNPRQARELLTALTYVGGYDRASGRRLRAFFGCLYYAAMRPGEALGLRRSDCTLPASGWGRIELTETRPTAGKAWTDSGEPHDRRGLKQRTHGEVRIVPVPPPLVRLLREHLEEFGTAEDGRLFSSERGNVIAASSYSRAWKHARELALVPDQVASVLAFRSYDLRHAGVSQWLNSGVPAPEVAARAGHSVDVLLKIYAKCVDGQEQEMNDRILKGLGEEDDTDE